MLYYLFDFLDKSYHLIGSRLFQYSTFRASLAFIFSFLIAIYVGKRIIRKLQKHQIGEIVRNLGLPGEVNKKDTPTMGGIIMIIAILIPIFLLAKLDNVYIWLIVFAVISMGAIGMVDDYIKVLKQNKDGVKGKYKIFAQIILGIVVGAVLYAHKDVRVKDFEKVYYYNIQFDGQVDWEKPVKSANFKKGMQVETIENGYYVSHDIRSFKTNVPFMKDNLWDYSYILKPFTDDYMKWGWIIFIPVVIFIITAVSNATNLTDGLDGLTSGISAINMLTLGLFAFVSGNIVLADYLNILYIPESGEVLIACAAVVGACVGFLWYNAHPATIFMGDTGSLMLGGVIATIAIIVRKELLIPVLSGIFLAETVSVIIQRLVFKYRLKRYGRPYAEANRFFKMTPLHHHYQKLGYFETKITIRFWIVSIILAVVAVITLKIR
ncbi:MAG: phospho-N-acetylmuramoyl-pentapeptide-transferase [Chitinophagales bacterium]|nr:phospho-N-acetylmuramoyl-pentapeptide-transferase [Chitinophagales bacterium]